MLFRSNANTCLKLAAFYTIQDHLYGSPDNSYEPAPVSQEEISYRSDTDFSRAVQGKNMDDILAIVDDLMNALQVLSPRLYRLTMKKFESS